MKYLVSQEEITEENFHEMEVYLVEASNSEEAASKAVHEFTYESEQLFVRVIADTELFEVEKHYICKRV